MAFQVQKPAPDFTAEAVMPDGSFKKVSLSDYKGKYVVLFFYPLDFTFVCPTEIIAFSDRMKDFEELGVQVRHKQTTHKITPTGPRVRYVCAPPRRREIECGCGRRIYVHSRSCIHSLHLSLSLSLPPSRARSVSTGARCER